MHHLSIARQPKEIGVLADEVSDRDFGPSFLELGQQRRTDPFQRPGISHKIGVQVLREVSQGIVEILPRRRQSPLGLARILMHWDGAFEQMQVVVAAFDVLAARYHFF